MQTCEKCGKVVDSHVYALENHGKIYKWVCESCYFRVLKTKRRKKESEREKNEVMVV